MIIKVKTVDFCENYEYGDVHIMKSPALYRLTNILEAIIKLH